MSNLPRRPASQSTRWACWACWAGWPWWGCRPTARRGASFVLPECSPPVHHKTLGLPDRRPSQPLPIPLVTKPTSRHKPAIMASKSLPSAQGRGTVYQEIPLRVVAAAMLLAAPLLLYHHHKLVNRAVANFGCSGQALKTSRVSSLPSTEIRTQLYGAIEPAKRTRPRPLTIPHLYDRAIRAVLL